MSEILANKLSYDKLNTELIEAKNKIKKEHLKNYFKYLFTQANDFINKYSI